MDEAKRQAILKQYGLDKPPPGKEAWWTFVEQADPIRLLRAVRTVRAEDELREEGELLGMREALRQVLAERGLRLSPEQDAAIEACKELHEIKRWLRRAINATTTEEVLR